MIRNEPIIEDIERFREIIRRLHQRELFAQDSHFINRLEMVVYKTRFWPLLCWSGHARLDRTREKNLGILLQDHLFVEDIPLFDSMHLWQKVIFKEYRTVTFTFKSLDLVFFDIEIAAFSEFFNFKKEATIVLNRFPHRLVQKNEKNTRRVKK